ncbi:sigma 54-interacting transcriptional regulator [Sporosarcina sp. Sa2YVA2]|uniref:Sigma 54-interacting transcriptional regulator n=1 Tax=Sporosarcina quadrami TaxID=2762234 RepID=A0ABR8UCQ1_9BACL|nr:sigma 54-interacting transcriptional regulator [Sporosarcina quadrami]MBD7985822.1 sigma 54-interacting transcriptional regulator [Sporosarcina quadrami]
MKHTNKLHLEELTPLLFEGVIITDEKGIIRTINKSVLDFFPKLHVSGLIGKQIKELISSKDLKLFYDHKQDMRNINLTIGMHHLMGNFRFSNEENVFIILKNITNLHQLTADLGMAQRQIRLFHSILDQIDDGICFVDSNQKIVFYNKKIGEFDTKEPSSILGEQYTTVFPETTYTNDPLLNALTTERVIIQNESFFSRSGKKYDVRKVNTPLFLGNQKIGALSTVKDLSNMSELGNAIFELSKAPYEQNSSSVVSTIDEKNKSTDFIHCTKSMKKILLDAERASKSSSNILIYGESGVGKRRLVNTITEKSGVLYTLHCSSLPTQFIEQILFGDERSNGLLEQVNGETILLDKINCLELSLQDRLFNVIKDKKVYRREDGVEIPFNVRFICTMNEKPETAIKNRHLSEDFFYIVSGVTLRIPPLRERIEEIPLLVEHFINEKKTLFTSEFVTVSDKAMNIFTNYDYPGNVRQLEYIIEGVLAILHDEKIIGEEHVPTYLSAQNNCEPTTIFHNDAVNSNLSLTDRVEAFEKEMIIGTLIKTNYHITNAADQLGISRQSLNYKIRKYEIENLRGDT